MSVFQTNDTKELKTQGDECQDPAQNQDIPTIAALKHVKHSQNNVLGGGTCPARDRCVYGGGIEGTHL